MNSLSALVHLVYPFYFFLLRVLLWLLPYENYFFLRDLVTSSSVRQLLTLAALVLLWSFPLVLLWFCLAYNLRSN